MIPSESTHKDMEQHITCDNGSKLFKGDFATLGDGCLFPALASGLHDFPRRVSVPCFTRLVAGLHFFPPLVAVDCFLYLGVAGCLKKFTAPAYFPGHGSSSLFPALGTGFTFVCFQF